MIYPELDIDKCLIVPKDQELREKVTNVWKAPQIYFSGAHKVQDACVCVMCTFMLFLGDVGDVGDNWLVQYLLCIDYDSTTAGY